MNNNIKRQALSVIMANKRKNEEAYETLLAPLKKDVNYVETEKKLTALRIENARKAAYGEKIDTSQEKQLVDCLKKIKQNYGLADLTKNYACSICKDEGFVEGKPCKCLKCEISKILLDGSGFEKLEDFDESEKTSGELSPIYKKMKEWCNKASNKTLIFLCGQTGVGKTHLTRCMANELINNGKIVKFTTAFKMNQDFKEFHKTLNESLLDSYLSPEYLFIDDLGSEPVYKNITSKYLYLIINERKTNHLHTVITSNELPDSIRHKYDEEDERIFSRISDKESSVNLQLIGKDRRLSKK